MCVYHWFSNIESKGLPKCQISTVDSPSIKDNTTQPKVWDFAYDIFPEGRAILYLLLMDCQASKHDRLGRLQWDKNKKINTSLMAFFVKVCAEVTVHTLDGLQ
ncbi:hypothetical protein O6H91_06G146800 [Diphasiastrum complanatum]|uniref:Uncharacterized protein n=1 Tax=Diphasiastrum complanatum TaxID=34168 RepID=A0ACC2DJV2_DIPCM|nr:hypothetical protein O6H91_06G146800 [Diphasiastrum complanatum]